MPTLLARNADILVTMDERRRELSDGGLFVRDGIIEQVGPTVELPQEAVETLWDLIETAPDTRIEVDLVAREVRAGGQTWPFALDDFARWRLLEGLDDIGLTLRNEADITTFEATRPTFGVHVG